MALLPSKKFMVIVRSFWQEIVHYPICQTKWCKMHSFWPHPEREKNRYHEHEQWLDYCWKKFRNLISCHTFALLFLCFRFFLAGVWIGDACMDLVQGTPFMLIGQIPVMPSTKMKMALLNGYFITDFLNTFSTMTLISPISPTIIVSHPHLYFCPNTELTFLVTTRASFFL